MQISSLKARCDLRALRQPMYEEMRGRYQRGHVETLSGNVNRRMKGGNPAIRHSMRLH
jgi:hypothetical protein